MRRNTDLSLQEKPYSLVRQLSAARALAEISSSGITVYDHRQRAHVYVSRNFYELFGYDIKPGRGKVDNKVFDQKVHPDDLAELAENGARAMKFMKTVRPEMRRQYKMISEYRIKSRAQTYIQVIEQHQVLEQDELGHIWLSLGVIDISPNQADFQGVRFQLNNFHTGENVQLYSGSDSAATRLSTREKEVLGMIRDGKLSKEISGLLSISVHTVNTYRQRILEKLAANNSMEAVYSARRLGIIS